MSTRTLPATSHEANYRMTDDIKQKHYQKILDALDKLGIGIYTDIAVVSGLEPHAVGRRLSELEGMQKVWKAGGKKLTPSGRNAFLYQLTTPPAKTEKEQNIYRNKGVVTAAEHAANILHATQPENIQQSLFNL